MKRSAFNMTEEGKGRLIEIERDGERERERETSACHEQCKT